MATILRPLNILMFASAIFLYSTNMQADPALDKHREALMKIMNQVPEAAPDELPKPVDVKVNAEPQNPDEVARKIVETHSDAARETSKLLADPMNYEEASNPDSAEVAAGASVDDSIGQKLKAADVAYPEFFNFKELKKYKKFAGKRIALPVYRVAFTVQTKATARSMSGFDNSRGAISTAMTVALAGIDNALMQSITDRAYKDYLTRLEEAGFDIVPFEEIQQTSGYQKIKFTKGLYSKNMQGTALQSHLERNRFNRDSANTGGELCRNVIKRTQLHGHLGECRS